MLMPLNRPMDYGIMNEAENIYITYVGKETVGGRNDTLPSDQSSNSNNKGDLCYVYIEYI